MRGFTPGGRCTFRSGERSATHLHEDTLAWLPLVLPVLPLVVLTPERPRLTAALALVGRWRDAARMLVGWRERAFELGAVVHVALDPRGAHVAARA